MRRLPWALAYLFVALTCWCIVVGTHPAVLRWAALWSTGFALAMAARVLFYRRR